MIVRGFGRNPFASFKSINSGLTTSLKYRSPYIQFNGNKSVPRNQRPGDKGLCSYRIRISGLERNSDGAPEEAPQNTRPSQPGVESSADSSAVVPATSAREPSAQVQHILHEDAGISLNEESCHRKILHHKLGGHHQRLEHYRMDVDRFR